MNKAFPVNLPSAYCCLCINRSGTIFLSDADAVVALPGSMGTFDEHFDALAKSCGMSRRKLNNYFRKTMNLTPVEYIRDVRMNYDTNFLVKNNVTIKEIAALCTCTNGSYFCKDFKRRFNMIPGQYRKKHHSII